MILVEDKSALMRKLGKKQMKFELQQPLTTIPPDLDAYNLALTEEGHALVYTYEAQGEQRGVTRLVEGLLRQNIRLKDINTTQSSLEDIFVDLVRKDG
jgi:ABC-2 type transport system ATP-binding protein